jgi:hypothetical protein
VLDHAGNTLRHGRLEDFEPPEDLSMIDKHSDKKLRKEKADTWVCVKCQCVNDRIDTECVECGNPRRRQTTVCVIDGVLSEVDVKALPNDAVTVADIRNFYLGTVWYGKSKNFNNPYGWAYHKTIARFRLANETAKSVIQWDWKNINPQAPDPETSRWLMNDYRRQQVIKSKYQSPGASL